ncbi:hypothetical protein [Bacillus pumilus]|uniref:hypothetical protein n=1 Tax=Bacillus pumilus TaxID=1408 RepID=UPI001CA40DD0|nr:hypothetical protein [Bacillus pumilus]
MRRVWQLPVKQSDLTDHDWVHKWSKYHAFINKDSICGKHGHDTDFFETGVAESEIIENPSIACKKCFELASKFYCPDCKNSRYFYNEVSVMAIKFIDNKRGAKDGKILHVDPTNVDNYFEPVYCYNCTEMVAEPMERKN